MKMVTLHCQSGDHSWERLSQRGKRPRNCPEHAPVPASAETEAMVPLSVANEAIDMASCNSHGTEGVEPILSGAALAKSLVEKMAILVKKDERRKRLYAAQNGHGN